MARRTPGTCTYCCVDADDIEDEHVIPQSWYPIDSFPGLAKPIVPACGPCNDEYQKVEDRVRLAWALCLAPENECARGIAEKVQRRLRPSAAKNERDARHRAGTRRKVLNGMFVAPVDDEKRFPAFGPREARWLRTPSGLLVRGTHAIELSIADVDAMILKFVRGLYRFETGDNLPADVRVRVAVVPESATERAVVELENQPN